jgi:uncharacterized protein YegL
MSSTTIMPGGGISKRPLHFFVLADCSGSMRGEKMQALNFAIADMLPHLVAWQDEQEQAQVLMRVIAFANEPHWHVRDPTPVVDLRWKALHYVQRGRTNMGAAFRMLAEALEPGNIERRALRPSILLVTDGLPTDPPGVFDAGLNELLSQPAGRSALRLAVAIGRDANSEMLNRFISDPAVPVLVADSIDQIPDRLVAASLAVSRMSEAGADREAVANRLLTESHNESGLGRDGAEDSIV